MNNIEKLRKRALYTAVAVFFIVFFILIADVRFINNPLLLFASVVVCFFAIKYAVDVVNEYKYSFAYEVLQPVFKKYDLSYEPDKGISETEALRSGLFNFSYDEFLSKDLIKGEDFVMSYVKFISNEIYIDRDGKKHKRKTVKYGGFLLSVDCDLHIKNDLLIIPDSFHLEDYLPITYEKKRVKLDSVEFEKAFDVYCDDQIEARRILNNAFMERLLNLHKKTSFHKIRFTKNTVYVTMKKESILSSVPLFKKINENIIEEIMAPIKKALYIKEFIKEIKK